MAVRVGWPSRHGRSRRRYCCSLPCHQCYQWQIESWLKCVKLTLIIDWWETPPGNYIGLPRFNHVLLMYKFKLGQSKGLIFSLRMTLWKTYNLLDLIHLWVLIPVPDSLYGVCIFSLCLYGFCSFITHSKNMHCKLNVHSKIVCKCDCECQCLFVLYVFPAIGWKSVHGVPRLLLCKSAGIGSSAPTWGLSSFR